MDQTLTTGCDRLKHAASYITEKGWLRGGLRMASYDKDAQGRVIEVNPGEGGACLVGALITTEEYKSRYLDRGGNIAVYLGNTSVYPGLADAYKFLGFADGTRAANWNDRLPDDTGKDEVLARINQARAEHCEGAKDGNA